MWSCTLRSGRRWRPSWTQSGASPAQQFELLIAFLADPAHTASAEAVMVMIRKNAFRAAPSQDEILAELPATHLENLLTADEASLLQRQGFFVIRNALPPDTVRTMQAVMDELEAEYKPRLNIGEHKRVYPPTATEDLDGSHGWHRDSGKFSIGERDPNGEDTGFEHQVSIKIAYALSEMDERTGMQVIPGTHLGKGVRGPRMHIPAVVGTQDLRRERMVGQAARRRRGGQPYRPTDCARHPAAPRGRGHFRPPPLPLRTVEPVGGDVGAADGVSWLLPPLAPPPR